MRRLGIRVVVLAAVAAVMLAGCNANPTGGTAATATTGTSKGGTLYILNSPATVTLDPAKSQNLAITTLGLFLRRLTTWDIQPGKPATVVPDLATDTGSSSADGKTWTYHLKPGLKYSDGSMIVAADVKYAVERSFAPELSGGLAYHKGLLVGGDTYKGPYTGGELASIETPDTSTIVFHLNKPYGDWPWIVSMPAFAPVPKAKDNPQNYIPVASGPYQVDSYQSGAALKLKRNPNWDAASDPVRTAGPDQIVFQLGQQGTVVAQRLIADSGADRDAFGASFVPAPQLAQVQGNPGAKARLVSSDPGPLTYLAINVRRGALADLRVRQALEYAVDKQAVQVAFGGALGGQPASTLITPGIAGRTEFNLYPAPASGDVAKAKQLLAAAGHASDLNLKMLVDSDNAQDVGGAQAVQASLKRAGITVQLKLEDEDTWLEDSTNDKGDYDLDFSGWQPDFPSANGNIEPLFHSREIGGGGFNLSRYSQPEADSLIDQATAEVDPGKSQALWVQADKRILQDAPIVPLLFTRNSFLRGSNVENFFVAAFPAYPNYLKVSVKP